MITKRDIWTAIWYSENSTPQKTADFLRSLVTPKEAVSNAGTTKIAIIVGHNKKHGGAFAVAPLNTNEFNYNSKVADVMVDIANSDPDIEVKVFKRKPMGSYSIEIDEVYRRVNNWNPEVALELHFNWLGGAGRVEMLHYSPSSKGALLGKILLQQFGKLMQVHSSQRKLLPRTKSSRGGRSLWACKAPVVLTEPFDSSNEEHRRVVKAKGVRGLAEAYIRALKLYLK